MLSNIPYKFDTIYQRTKKPKHFGQLSLWQYVCPYSNNFFLSNCAGCLIWHYSKVKTIISKRKIRTDTSEEGHRLIFRKQPLGDTTGILSSSSSNVINLVLETVQDFLCKLAMKQHMHLV